MSVLAKINENEDNIVWQPIPNSSQVVAITAPCDHILYEGTRGATKTLTQLMRFRARVGIGYGQYWRGVIYDLEFDNLAGLVAESKKWFPKFNDGCKFLESPSAYKWVWATGEELLFRHVKKIEDYEGFHGHEYPFIGWNELTKFSTSELYDKFMSCNRSSFMPERDTPKIKIDNETWQYATHDGKPLPPIPLEVFSTTNPSGVGRTWVKRRFIDIAPRGVVVKREISVFDPQTQKDIIVVKKQITILGSWRENIYLTAQYIAELESITDPNLRRAWLNADWDVTLGGAFDDVWQRKVHVLPRFAIPKTWRVDRAFDWGSSHPFSVGWFAEANGDEARIFYNGQEFSFCPPVGTIIQIYEWYGTKEIGTNKGLKLSAKEIAKGIKDIETSLLANGWIAKKPYAGAADNQISDKRESDTDTIAAKMLAEGIDWTRSDKSAGSRIQGLQLMRDRFSAAVKGEGAALYFTENCIASISIIPTLPRDSKNLDDVDTDAEDHCYDMVRYRVLANGRKGTKFDVNWG